MFSSLFGPNRSFVRSSAPAKESGSRNIAATHKPVQQGLSRSRSTSVGSSNATSDRPQQTRSPPVEEEPPRRDELPDINYPVPFVIRNTFVEAPLARPVSLDEFIEERKINSCPPSAIGLPPGLPASEVLSEQHDGLMLDSFLATAVKKVTHSPPQLPLSPQLASLLAVPQPDYHHHHISTPFCSEEVPAGTFDFIPSVRGGRSAAVGGAPAAQMPPPPQWVPHLQEAVVPPPPTASADQAYKATLQPMFSTHEVENMNPAQARQGQILQLAEALPEPELGSPECPTMGSRGHGAGNCKPCAFVHTKGCENGTECIFCHLCEPGEKKRRAKEKKERRREARATWGLF
mmetsp:Transcript_67270/g.161245  ORF Transcript_67270/g.161245 Transcript_67270/m.161245 type:complete len:347 (-) Transcript_67270:68-1108(-)|eukprot:CAMPEP_0178405420 /NCGR_PEP_ID=MMETSP0689_2-20121128/18389_1 /TAXON_ID=160604 /ORGANISM="Amphidinium massartii, Strain CS-259" /LENGTH=346 /DNA_ID=CAMNT_0020026433 /DNA_START=118 /DNA_END=1158 /DNA_ORIENTATION=+